MSITNDSPEEDMGPGEVFKKKHGYSRTMANNMRKHGVNTPDEYRAIRNKRRGKQNRKVDKPVVATKTPQKGGNNARQKK